jgi:hypothetical protein
MSLFKKKVTFPTACEYSFNTWEKHYIAEKNRYTSAAIESEGLTGKFELSREQIDILWTELEYFHNYVIIVYANFYFSGKQSSEDISYVESQKYAHFLLGSLRGEDKAAVEKSIDGLVSFVDAVEAKTSSIDETAAVNAEMITTFGAMVLAERAKAKLPDLNDAVLSYLVSRVWAAGQATFSSRLKIVWK